MRPWKKRQMAMLVARVGGKIIKGVRVLITSKSIPKIILFFIHTK